MSQPAANQPNTAKSKIKQWMPYIIAVDTAIIIGLGAYFIPKLMDKTPDSPTATLHQFYPADTTFFLEASPGKTLTQRSLQYAVRTAGQKASQSGKPGEQPLDAEKLEKLKKGIASYQEAFKPGFSFGAWIAENHTDKKKPDNDTAPNSSDTASNDAESLAVFPLKKDTTVPELAKQFEIDLESWTQDTVAKDITAYSDPQKQVSLAVYKKNLLLANHVEVLKTAIPNYQDNNIPNVYESTLNKTYLSKLPKKRQGTFLINNTVYTRDILNSKPFREKQVPPNVIQQVQELSDVTPVIVGALQVENDTRLKLFAHIPFQLDKIKDTERRDSMKKALFHHNQTLQSPDYLPEDTVFFVSMVNLNDSIIHSLNNAGNPELKGRIDGTKAILSAFQLDLEKDLIGLLNGEVTLAFRKPKDNQGSTPFVLISSSKDKEAVINKLLPLLTMGMLPVKHKTEQIGSVSANTFTVPKPPAAGAESPSVSLALLHKENTASPGIYTLGRSGNLQAVVSVFDGKSGGFRKSDTLQEFAKDLPNKVSVMFYGDGNSLRSLSAAAGPQDIPEPPAISAIAGVGYSVNEDAYEGQVVIDLAQTDAKDTTQ